MKLLVTGTSGQLAQSLLEAGLATGIDIVAIRRPQLDLAVPASIRPAITSARPDLVVSAAAYTAVDKAESEADLAMRVNGAGAGMVAETCDKLGIPLIHLSTDYVFDGTKPSAYLEGDPTGPVSVYGRSKLAGEAAVQAACARHVIVRTAWVYSPFGNNFVKTMLRLAASKPEFGVVDDQIGCPTYAPHLAQAVLQIAAGVLQDNAGFAGGSGGPWGIYHASGAGETTWCGFAREVFRLSGERGGPVVKVNAITTADYPTPAKRPANSRLDCGKLAAVFNVRLPDWRHGAAECVSRLV